MTVSHLRFGPEPIRSTYLVSRANFVACHLPTFLEKSDLAKPLVPGARSAQHAIFKGRSVVQAADALQETLIARKAKFYVIDATKVAHEAAWADASTPSCRLFLRVVRCAAREKHRVHQVFHQKDYGKKARKSWP